MPTKIATLATDHSSLQHHESAPTTPVAHEGPNPLNRSVSSSSVTTANVAGSTKTARRPSRKSTLTQQQKNQRRQRATQEQLVTLETEFNKNPTPSAAVRERIAEDISMTERSVQIWFQNRRAKIKMIAKKGIESGEDCDAIPESMRQYLALNFDPTTAGARSLINKATGQTSQSLGDTLSGKTTIIHFTCETLCIGSWRRFGQNFMDLVIFCSPDKACMTYYIHNDSAGYKIEYPFSSIRNIVLEMPDATTSDDTPKQEGLMIELIQPPTFYIDCSNSGGFTLCQDFTEDQQGTNCLFHFLCGNAKTLSSQLAKLVALDSFQNRHRVPSYVPFPAPPPVITPVSEADPFSEYVHRPASQPNNRAAMGRSNSVRQNYLGADLNQPRRHKRQRSRSVPAIVDHTALMEDESTASLYQANQRFGHPLMPPRMLSYRLPHHNAGIPFDGPQFSPVGSPPMPPQLQINTSLPTLTSANPATPTAAYPFSAQTPNFPPLSASTTFSGDFPPAPDFFNNPANSFGTGFEAAPLAPGFGHMAVPSINTDQQQQSQPQPQRQQQTLFGQQSGSTPPSELTSSLCDTQSTVASEVPTSSHSGSSPDVKIGTEQQTATAASFGNGGFVLRELNDMYARQKLDSTAGSVAASPPQSSVCPFPEQNMGASVTAGPEDSFGMSAFPAFVDTDPMSPGFDEFPVSSGLPFLGSNNGMNGQF